MSGRVPLGLALALTALVAGCRGVPSEPALQDYGAFRDFELTAQTGERFDTASLRGRPILLFFGYTACPDVCPTTLSRLGEAVRLARADGNDPIAVFVTVDPQADTPTRLTEVLGFFEFPGVGLTGTPEEIDAVRESTGIFAAKTPSEGGAGYVVDHTVSVLLVDEAGRLRYLFQTGDPPRLMADAVARLAAEG